MTQEQINTYKMRISQAGIAEYTVILFEMEIQWIDEALEAYEKDNITAFVALIDKAQGVQVELMSVMNLENSVSLDIYSVFAYINKQLIKAKIKRIPNEIDACKSILVRYHKSFLALVDSDQEGPVITGSEKIYAGLTYGTEGLVESSTGGIEYKI